jgi:hypothetical protein
VLDVIKAVFAVPVKAGSPDVLCRLGVREHHVDMLYQQVAFVTLTKRSCGANKQAEALEGALSSMSATLSAVLLEVIQRS